MPILMGIDRIRVDAEAGVVFGVYGKQLKPCVSNCGYLRVCISNRPYKRESVHRLVWMSVHGQIPNGMQINHKNGNKKDNRIANLELVTPSQNIIHAHKIGLHPRGENRVQSKLTATQVLEMRALRAEGWSYPKLAERYNVSHPTIQAAIKGVTWKHIGGVPSQS